MMMSTYDDRQAQPSAENAALTVAARGARRGLAATKQRVPSSRVVVFAEMPQTLRTLQRLRAEKAEHIPALVWQFAIQYPR